MWVVHDVHVWEGRQWAPGVLHLLLLGGAESACVAFQVCNAVMGIGGMGEGYLA